MCLLKPQLQKEKNLRTTLVGAQKLLTYKWRRSVEGPRVTGLVVTAAKLVHRIEMAERYALRGSPHCSGGAAGRHKCKRACKLAPTQCSLKKYREHLNMGNFLTEKDTLPLISLKVLSLTSNTLSLLVLLCSKALYSLCLQQFLPS